MDYNIYIHNVEESKPTTPKKPKDTPTKPKDDQDQEEKLDLKQFSLGAIAKAVPAVAAAIAVLKVIDGLVGQYLPFQAQMTGDYRATMAYQNFHQGMNLATKPFSGAWGIFRQKELWKVENERRRMNAELLGDTEINKIWRGV